LGFIVNIGIGLRLVLTKPQFIKALYYDLGF
jgi:hypothetical protein